MTARFWGIGLGLFTWLYGVGVVLGAFLTSVPNELAIVGFGLAITGGFLFQYSWRSET